MSSNEIFYSLPEDILLRILSLMPTKYAVRTSILSKSWWYRWTLVTNLDFDYRTNTIDYDDSYAFTSFVDGVLKLCETTQVKLFRLYISNSEVISKSSVSNWISVAIRLNVSELDIKVSRANQLPLSIFTCKTITKLKLRMSEEINCRIWESSCQVNLPCLKNLDIALYAGDFSKAFKLINGCPMLESLSWGTIHRYTYEEDYIFNIPTLKRLKLTLPNCNVVVRNKVVLRVPNLEYLFVGGYLSSIFVMEDVSSLVEAYVSFPQISFDQHHPLFELLEGLSGVKSLSIIYIPSASLFIDCNFRLPCFPNMKHLKFTSYWKYGPIFQLLESSPKLEHVYIEKLQESPWIEPKVIPACMLTSLTTIKFSISTWWKYDTRFLEYMLRNAEVLKTVTVTSEFSCNIEKEKELCEKLLKFPRVASGCCEMHFH